MPRLRFVCETIPNACGWNGAPLVSRDHRLVVVGGGSADDTARQAVLQGIDLDGGRARFTTWVEQEWPTVIEGSEPRAATRADGTVFFAASVYRHNLDGRLLAVLPDGTRLADDDLGDDAPFVASDLGTKLWTAVVPAGPVVPDALVFTWTYRQIRDAGSALRVAGEDRPRWTSKERCAGVVGGRFVGVAADRSQPRALVLRDVEDGREVARRPLGEGAIVAAVDTLVLVADRTAQRAAFRARARSLEEDMLEGRITLEEEIARREQHVDAPVRVQAVDPATGALRWEREIEGDVLDARELRTARATAIVASTRGPSGDARAEIVDASGRTLARFPVRGQSVAPRAWLEAGNPNDSNRIFGETRSGLLLHAEGDRLFGIDWRDGGRVVLDLALPNAGRAFRRSIDERWLPKASVAVDEDDLFIAGVTEDTHRLWVFDLAP